MTLGCSIHWLIVALAPGITSEWSLLRTRWVDGGGNPDAYTSALFQRTLAANQVAKGKVEALRQFRGELLKQAEVGTLQHRVCALCRGKLYA